MKKIIYLIPLIALFFSACNPNEEIYKQLDSLQVPFNKQLNYTLTDDDYNTIKTLALAKAETAEDSAKANEIGTNHFFTDSIKPADYVPDFLANTFLALDSASSVSVTYNFSYKYEIADDMIFDSGDTCESGNPADFIDSINVASPQEGQKVLVKYTGEVISGNDTSYETDYALYIYDGTAWARPDDALELTNSDFEMMTGSPASYHNFSSSDPAEYYLPIFLKLKYPYASDGDAFEIVYKYYLGSGASTYYYDLWQFDGSDWFNIEAKSDQFIHNGEKWVFDPTVNYTMSNDDYQIIVDWVSTNDTLNGYMSSYGNTEYYFGASSYYGNFDMRVSKRQANDPNGYLTDLSDDEALEVIWDRIPQAIQIFLEGKFSDAQPFVNGVPVYYIITFATYEPERHEYSIKFLCTDVGTFEYQEGPTMVK